MTTRFRAIALVSILLAAVSTPVLAQDAVLPTSQDTWLNGNNPGAVLGAQPVMVIAKTPKIGLVQFDTSALVSPDIASATLNASVDSVGTGGTINVHVVRSGWSEGSVSLNTVPNYDAVPIQSFPISTGDAGNTVSVDISAVVQEWAADTGSNFGIALTTTNANMKFDSKESGSPMTVEVVFSSVVKPNVATVEKQGGDYTNPLDAVADLDTWCGTTNHFQPFCKILVGPGEFQLESSLVIPDTISLAIIGSGVGVTVLSSTGVPTTIDGGNEFRDFSLENDGNNGALATGINIDSGTLENISVLVTHANTANGILTQDETKFKNVTVNVHSTLTGSGIEGEAIQGDNVTVSVRSSGTASGIGDNTEESEMILDDFKISVSGGQIAWGLAGTCECLVTATNGLVEAFGGSESYGIILSDSGWTFVGSNLNVNARSSSGRAVGIYASNWDFTGDITLDRSTIYSGGTGHDDEAVTGIGIELSTFDRQILHVKNSDISGKDVGVVVTDSSGLDNAMSFDASIVSGRTNSIVGLEGWTINVGTSKLVGPTSAGGSTMKCALVYDEDYNAYVDTCP